jgi:CheY-like chemotaxis protein
MVAGLLELHGGSVRVESQGFGHGSEFFVRLPLAPAPEHVSAPRAAPSTPRRHVLVIEDHEDTAEIMQMLLTLEGHEVEVARDGATGLALARSVHPEVVFCDLGLPDMAGYSVARAVRADASIGRPYLCALSGYALPEDRERSAAAGFDRHLAKPPSVEDLKQVLAAAPPAA